MWLCVADAGIEIESIARSLTHKYGSRLNPVKVKSIKDIEKDNRAFYEDVVEYGYVMKGLEYFYEQVYRWEVYNGLKREDVLKFS